MTYGKGCLTDINCQCVVSELEPVTVTDDPSWTPPVVVTTPPGPPRGDFHRLDESTQGPPPSLPLIIEATAARAEEIIYGIIAILGAITTLIGALGNYINRQKLKRARQDFETASRILSFVLERNVTKDEIRGLAKTDLTQNFLENSCYAHPKSQMTPVVPPPIESSRVQFAASTPLNGGTQPTKLDFKEPQINWRVDRDIFFNRKPLGQKKRQIKPEKMVEEPSMESGASQENQ